MKPVTLRAVVPLLLLFLPVHASGIPSSRQETTPEQKAGTRVLHQLRIYEIFDNTGKEFHDRFRDHAMRIMKRYDFHIVATWESRKDGRTKFVYLLEWPDTETMKDRWAKFLADEEWIRIKQSRNPASGPIVGDIQDITLELTNYSPQRSLVQKN